MTLALTGARIFTGEATLDGKALLIADGVVQDIADTPPPGAEIVALPGDHMLAPGFIDIQVNGGGGVLFNDTPDVETIRRIGAAHRKFGTTGFLPTLVSDTPDKLPRALAAARAAIGEVPGALGIHVEGPFISQAKRGVHNAAVLRAMNADERRLLTTPIGGVMLVTVAPEVVPPQDIAALNGAGVRVFLGHSDASVETVEAALAAGACGFTHLFNAMSGFTGRAPGMVGAALADGASWCGLIVDRHHVAAASLRAALAAKPRGKCVLVTDAMPPVGADRPNFVLYGETLTVKDGRLVTAGGTLAGSALDMASAVRNCVEWLGVSLDEGLRMASGYAADALGIGHIRGRLLPGFRADIVALDPGLHVTRTWIGGA